MADPVTPPPSAPSQAGAQLLQLIHGYAPAQLIYVAAKLGLADALSYGPRSAEELAAEGPIAPAILSRILRGLVNCGVLALTPDARFALTPLGERLQTHVPGSLRGLALLHGEVFYPAWGTLLATAQTGAPALPQVFGVDFFTYLADHPEAEAVFNDFITRTATQLAGVLLKLYDFSGVGLIVDLGGAQGTLLGPILAAYPELHGILFDEARVLTGTEVFFEAAGLGDRCTGRAGDFFVAVPAGGDLYLLSQVLHDWEDSRAARILENCRAAMKESGKLLIIERLMPEHIIPPESAVGFDLNMMVLTGGRERTAAEYEAMLAATSFHLERVTPLLPTMALLEAVPALRE
jgi:hypothetical protein